MSSDGHVIRGYSSKYTVNDREMLSSIVLFEGAGGVGKSTSLKHISLVWANGESRQLKKFDFVFCAALKLVKQNQSLEEIIVKQHAVLKRHNVTPNEIKQIFEGKMNQKILLLLDGYDEYLKGTSGHVDSALIKESLPYSTIVLTSRETTEVYKLKPFMDVEAEIIGFDPKQVKEYITKFLGSDRKYHELWKLLCVQKHDTKGCHEQSTNQPVRGSIAKTEAICELQPDLNGIMQVPIMLHMLCVLFQRKVSFPKTRTGIISAIAKRCPDWESQAKKLMMCTRKFLTWP